MIYSKFTAYFDDREYEQIRKANMFCKFSFCKFYRDVESGEVTFTTAYPIKLVKQLDDMFDFTISFKEVWSKEIEQHINKETNRKKIA